MFFGSQTQGARAPLLGTLNCIINNPPPSVCLCSGNNFSACLTFSVHWYPTSLGRVMWRASRVIRECKNEVFQQVCVFALCVCALGGHCCHPSEPQLLCLAGGSTGHLWKAFFETKTEQNCGVLMNQSLGFYKSVPSKALRGGVSGTVVSSRANTSVPPHQFVATLVPAFGSKPTRLPCWPL